MQTIISALMKSNAWQDSVFILTYDEGGGLYDHVPPVSVPLPDANAPGIVPIRTTVLTVIASRANWAGLSI